ncbi:MAG: hypothetical protein QW338_04570 [Conexivisphaerales archaeon]
MIIEATEKRKLPRKFEFPWGKGLDTATMTFMSSYNIYKDKRNTEGDKAISHPWKSRGIRAMRLRN